MNSRRLKIIILQILDFIPDKYMVMFQYFLKTHRFLNLKNPRRFTEKLQFFKLFYRDPIMKKCVDKYDVREYIEENNLSSILNQCLGIYSSPDEIDFSTLPKSFVIKDTLGGGGNSVVIVKDKSKLNMPELIEKLKHWVDEPYNKKHPGREWVYEGRKHRIIIEKYIAADPNKGGLIDYKFFCNYGEIKFLYVVADRILGQKAGFGIYTPDFERMPVGRKDEEPLMRIVNKPVKFDELKIIAELLSKPFPESRIDLYNVDGKIYFGEITFYDGSGYMSFTPDEYDIILGDMFIFNTEDRRWQR